MLQKFKITSCAFIYFLLFGFSFIALQVTTEEDAAANPDMVCNVQEYTIKQCGNPASIHDPCPILGIRNLRAAVSMCYAAGDAYQCSVHLHIGGLGACTWGPPTPQWLEFKDWDDRSHYRGAYARPTLDPITGMPPMEEDRHNPSASGCTITKDGSSTEGRLEQRCLSDPSWTVGSGVCQDLLIECVRLHSDRTKDDYRPYRKEDPGATVKNDNTTEK